MRADLRFILPVPPGEAFGYVTEMRNWPEFWAGFVRFVGPAEDARWQTPGDRVSVLVRLLGQERLVEMELCEFEQDRRIVYLSRQRGLPEAHHERHFAPAAGGSEYRVVVECEQRFGFKGLIDRWVVKASVERAIRRAADRIRSAVAAPAGHSQSSHYR